MFRPMNTAAAALACALALASGASYAQSTFDFSSVPGSAVVTNTNPGTFLDPTTGVTANLTNSAATATFTDPGNSGDFAFSAVGAVSGLNAPVILSDSGGNGTAISDVLNISFSQAVGSFAFNFGLGNIASTLTGFVVPIPGDTLNVTLTTNQGVFTQSLTTTTSNDTGTYVYNGAFGTVTNVSLSATTSAVEAGASNYATVNIEPTPEPGTWALMAAGLLAVGGIARRRRR